MNDVITLAGFLGVVSTTKVIKINLYNNETKNLIISFDMPGYKALDDTLEAAPIKTIELVNLTTINIFIETT